ncbi:MAG TPA: hypothetical protein VNE00_06420 [Paraburkholderia sp.]|jgi:hypothetical protein|nr:hypothetical protein [Paraburkholderia sp.]
MQSDVEMELVNEFGTQELHIRLGDHSALLGASEVDRLIEQLGLLRCELRPEVNRNVSREDCYAVELEPRWRAIPYPMIDGVVLFLRHGGFGWTGFAIPTTALDELIEMATNGASGIRGE